MSKTNPSHQLKKQTNRQLIQIWEHLHFEHESINRAYQLLQVCGTFSRGRCNLFPKAAWVECRSIFPLFPSGSWRGQRCPDLAYLAGSTLMRPHERGFIRGLRSCSATTLDLGRPMHASSSDQTCASLGKSSGSQPSQYPRNEKPAHTKRTYLPTWFTLTMQS